MLVRAVSVVGVQHVFDFDTRCAVTVNEKAAPVAEGGLIVRCTQLTNFLQRGIQLGHAIGYFAPSSAETFRPLAVSRSTDSNWLAVLP